MVCMFTFLHTRGGGSKTGTHTSIEFDVRPLTLTTALDIIKSTLS